MYGESLNADLTTNEWWWAPGGLTDGSMSDPMRIILLDIGGGDTILVMIDSQEAAEQAALVEQAMPILETFRFAG